MEIISKTSSICSRYTIVVGNYRIRLDILIGILFAIPILLLLSSTALIMITPLVTADTSAETGVYTDMEIFSSETPLIGVFISEGLQANMHSSSPAFEKSVNESIQITAEDSKVPQDKTVIYKFDTNEDGKYDIVTNENSIEKEFMESGNHKIYIKVIDLNGNYDYDSTTIKLSS